MMKTGTRQPALAFDAGFITGVDEIDDQHRNLVSLANEAALVLARDPTESQVRHLVQELLSYAIYHFRTEETLMREYGYSDTDAEAAARHIDRHRRFAARVVAVQEALDRHEAVDGAALVAFPESILPGFPIWAAVRAAIHRLASNSSSRNCVRLS